MNLLWEYCFLDVKQYIIHNAPTIDTFFRDRHASNTILLQEKTFDVNIENLSISHSMISNISSWNIESCKCLKKIMIGDHCGANLMDFVLKDMPVLEEIIIGNKSFTQCLYDFLESHRKFHVYNCPKLLSIVIGFKSFTDCQDFKLQGDNIRNYFS